MQKISYTCNDTPLPMGIYPLVPYWYRANLSKWNW